MTMEKRFKRYEAVSDSYLTRRTPVIGRIDGRAFHTLTRDCEKPFDEKFHTAMRLTAAKLCREIQGCKMAYLQSDEISLLITDYETIQTEPWFDYRVNKMCSIAASIAAVEFTQIFGKVGHFDARFFNLPENDVCNYFVYRQRDAERNSVNALAQSRFSQKHLQNKSVSALHDMLHEIGVNWNDLPDYQKRGYVWYRAEGTTTETHHWVTRHEQPEFSKQREFVENFLKTKDLVATA